MTKEEKYLLKLYEMALVSGDPQSPVSKEAAASSIGVSPKGMPAIVNGLLQANFIKKSGDHNVYLTENGIRLIKTLISS